MEVTITKKNFKRKQVDWNIDNIIKKNQSSLLTDSMKQLYDQHYCKRDGDYEPTEEDEIKRFGREKCYERFLE